MVNTSLNGKWKLVFFSSTENLNLLTTDNTTCLHACIPPH